MSDMTPPITTAELDELVRRMVRTPACGSDSFDFCDHNGNHAIALRPDHPDYWTGPGAVANLRERIAALVQHALTAARQHPPAHEQGGEAGVKELREAATEALNTAIRNGGGTWTCGWCGRWHFMGKERCDCHVATRLAAAIDATGILSRPTQGGGGKAPLCVNRCGSMIYYERTGNWVCPNCRSYTHRCHLPEAAASRGGEVDNG